MKLGSEIQESFYTNLAKTLAKIVSFIVLNQKEVQENFWNNKIVNILIYQETTVSISGPDFLPSAHPAIRWSHTDDLKHQRNFPSVSGMYL